jgi:hypothetical protein
MHNGANSKRGHDSARVRRDHAGQGGNLVRTAGNAREKAARGSPDEDIGDAEASDDCDPQKAPAESRRRDTPYSTWRKNSPVDFLQMQDAEFWCAIRG